MKTGLLSAFALAISNLFITPAFAAQDCTQIVQELNKLSATIDRDASSYWMGRKTVIETLTAPPRNSVAAARQTERGAFAKTQSATAKATMPVTLKNFAALTSTAKSQKCLPPEKLRELREAAFTRARAVNFDEIPKTPNTEGAPAEKKPPRMPVR